MIRFGSYLGPNTSDPVRILAGYLSAELGVEVATDLDLAYDSRLDLITSGGVDLVWMCGLLTVDLIDSGRLDADIVAAPVFAGADGPTYRSVVLVGSSAPHLTLADLEGGRLVINEEGSWSGHHALRAHLPPTRSPFFGSVVESGSHLESVRMVVEGEADCAAVDDTVWRHLLGRKPGLVERLRVVEATPAWPAPPFSVGTGADRRLAPALVAVFGDGATAEALRRAGLDDIRPAADADYDPIRRAARASRALLW